MTRTSTFLNSILLSLMGLGISACDPLTIVGVGGAAAVGTLAAREKGISGSVKDVLLENRVKQVLETRVPDIYPNLYVLADRGYVVVAGVIDRALPSGSIANQLQQELKKVEGVRYIYIHLEGGDPARVDTATDQLAGIRLRSSLASDMQIASRNYHILCVNRILYIIGVAQNQAEKDAVLSYASQVPNVRWVLDAIDIKQEVRQQKMIPPAPGHVPVYPAG